MKHKSVLVVGPSCTGMTTIATRMALTWAMCHSRSKEDPGNLEVVVNDSNLLNMRKLVVGELDKKTIFDARAELAEYGHNLVLTAAGGFGLNETVEMIHDDRPKEPSAYVFEHFWSSPSEIEHLTSFIQNTEVPVFGSMSVVTGALKSFQESELFKAWPGMVIYTGDAGEHFTGRIIKGPEEYVGAHISVQAVSTPFVTLA